MYLERGRRAVRVEVVRGSARGAEARMLKRTSKAPETVDAYKKRLRRTALNLPRDVVRKAVLALPKRMRAVAAAKGGDIPRD